MAFLCHCLPLDTRPTPKIRCMIGYTSVVAFDACPMKLDTIAWTIAEDGLIDKDTTAEQWESQCLVETIREIYGAYMDDIEEDIKTIIEICKDINNYEDRTDRVDRIKLLSLGNMAAYENIQNRNFQYIDMLTDADGVSAFELTNILIDINQRLTIIRNKLNRFNYTYSASSPIPPKICSNMRRDFSLESMESANTHP